VRFDAAGHAIWKRFLDATRLRRPAPRDRSAHAMSLEATP
jgi:hypothetical protein